jgi:hypothetical protein
MSGFLKGIKNSTPTGEQLSSANNSNLDNFTDWKSLFQDISILTDGLKQAGEASEHMRALSSRLLDEFNRVNQKHGTLLQNVIKSLDYCDGVNPRAIELEAVRSQLLAILRNEEVAVWRPELGKPMPEGCEPIGEKPSSEYPPQSVMEVLLPGYVWGEKVLLRRPRVIISKMPLPQVEPADTVTPLDEFAQEKMPDADSVGSSRMQEVPPQPVPSQAEPPETQTIKTAGFFQRIARWLKKHLNLSTGGRNAQ